MTMMTMMTMIHMKKTILVLNGGANNPKFTDAEVITIAIVGQLSQQDSQRAWYRYVKKNYIHFFPAICCREQFGRRLLQLHDIICFFQQNLCVLMSACHTVEMLIDSFPIELCNIQRLKGSSQPFVYDGANFCYCASKKLYYYGFKCHLGAENQQPPPEVVV